MRFLCVSQRALENIAYNFHVSVGMSAESLPSGNPIFIYYLQGSETHVGRIVVVGE